MSAPAKTASNHLTRPKLRADGASTSADEKDPCSNTDEDFHLPRRNLPSKIFRVASMRERQETEALIYGETISDDEDEGESYDHLQLEMNITNFAPHYGNTAKLLEELSKDDHRFLPPVGREISTHDSETGEVDKNSQYQVTLSNIKIDDSKGSEHNRAAAPSEPMGNSAYGSFDPNLLAETLNKVNSNSGSLPQSQYNSIPHNIASSTPSESWNRGAMLASASGAAPSKSTANPQYRFINPLLRAKVSNEVYSNPGTKPQDQYSKVPQDVASSTEAESRFNRKFLANRPGVASPNPSGYGLIYSALLAKASNEVNSNPVESSPYQAYKSQLKNNGYKNSAELKLGASMPGVGSNIMSSTEFSDSRGTVRAMASKSSGSNYGKLTNVESSEKQQQESNPLKLMASNPGYSQYGNFNIGTEADDKLHGCGFSFPSEHTEGAVVDNASRTDNGPSFTKGPSCAYGDVSVLQNILLSQGNGPFTPPYKGFDMVGEPRPQYNNLSMMSNYQDAASLANFSQKPNDQTKPNTQSRSQYEDFTKLANMREDQATSETEDSSKPQSNLLEGSRPQNRLHNLLEAAPSSQFSMAPYQDGSPFIQKNQLELMSSHREDRKTFDQYQHYGLNPGIMDGITTLGGLNRDDQYTTYGIPPEGATANGTMQTTIGNEGIGAEDSIRRLMYEQGHGNSLGMTNQAPPKREKFPVYNDLFPFRSEQHSNLSPSLLKTTNTGFSITGQPNGMIDVYGNIPASSMQYKETHGGNNQYEALNFISKRLKASNMGWPEQKYNLEAVRDIVDREETAKSGIFREPSSTNQYADIEKIRKQVEPEKPDRNIYGNITETDFLKKGALSYKNQLPTRYDGKALDKIQQNIRDDDVKVDYKESELVSQRIGSNFSPLTHDYNSVAKIDSEKTTGRDAVDDLNQTYKDHSVAKIDSEKKTDRDADDDLKPTYKDDKTSKNVKRKLSKYPLTKTERLRKLKYDVYSKSKKEWFSAIIKQHKHGDNVTVLYNNGDENVSKEMVIESPHLRPVKCPKYSVSPPTLEQMYQSTFAQIESNLHFETIKKGFMGKSYQCFTGQDFVQWVKRITSVNEDSVVEQLGTEFISNELVVMRKWTGKKKPKKDKEETILNDPDIWYSLNKGRIKVLLENERQIERNPLKGGERAVRLHWGIHSYLEVYSMSAEKWEMCHVDAILDPWLMVMYGEKDKKRAKWVHRLDYEAVRSPRHYWKRGTKVNVFSRTEKVWYSGILYGRKCSENPNGVPTADNTVDAYYGPKSKSDVGSGYTLSKTLDVNSDHVRPRILQNDRYCMKVIVEHLPNARKIERLKGEVKLLYSDLKLIKQTMSKYCKSRQFYITIKKIKPDEALLVMEEELEIDPDQLEAEKEYLSKELKKLVKLVPFHYMVYER